MGKHWVSNYWTREMNEFEEHTSLDSCSDYLQRPRNKYKNIVVQCPKCGLLYVGSYVPPTGTPFWKSFSQGENE